MVHAEVLAYCTAEADRLVELGRQLAAAFSKHRSLDEVRSTYDDGYRRLVEWRAKAVELVRQYRPEALDDFKRNNGYVWREYGTIRSCLSGTSKDETSFVWFIDEIREMKAVLELVSIPSVSEAATGSPQPSHGSDPRAVFLVHGHDESNTLKLQRYLRDDLKLLPIVLRYEPGKGRTLIEKFEQVAERASFAFVLLCPDDQVSCDDGSYAQARPNVVFELGWFYGRLGRSRVCILLKKGTKLHSDLDGISRVEFDDDVDLKANEVRRELEDVGILQT